MRHSSPSSSVILPPRMSIMSMSEVPRVPLQLPAIIPEFSTITSHFSPSVLTLVTPEFSTIPTQLGAVMPEFSTVAMRIVVVVFGLTRMPPARIGKARNRR